MSEKTKRVMEATFIKTPQWSMEFGRPNEMTYSPRDGVVLRLRHIRRGRVTREHWESDVLVEGIKVTTPSAYTNFKDAQEGAVESYRRWLKKQKGE